MISHLPRADETVGREAPAAELHGDVAKRCIRATPFCWHDPATLARRQFILGTWLLRGEVTAIIAPGGSGKTTFETALAVSLASGVDFFCRQLHEGALRVWCWNLEDDLEELQRQFAAATLQHGLSANDIADRLFVDGMDKALCTAIETPNGVQLVKPVFEALVEEIKHHKIDVLMIDPLVSSHAIGENDNRAIDAVAKAWKRVAQECRCAIVLVHHTRKTGGNAITVEDARGASALLGAVRIALTLNPMREDEASRFGIADPAERRSLVRVDMGKSNRSPAESAFWFKLVSVDLGNGEYPEPGDRVAAAVKWNPPDPSDGVSTRDIYKLQQAIAAGEYAENAQSVRWAGYVVAQVLGLDTDDHAHKARIKSLLKILIERGALKVERRWNTTKARPKPFVIVGNAVDPATLPALQTGVGAGGEVGKPDPIQPPHPTFIGRGGGGGGVGRHIAGEVG